VIGIKLAFALAVLAGGALGGALPLWRRATLGERVLGWGNAFTAGIFLGAGWIHMLPDSADGWRALGWEYPMAYSLAAVGFVVMLLVEHVLLSESAHEVVHAPSSERFAHLSEDGRGFTAYAVLIALSVHSILAGLALGATPELGGALVIFVAIAAHKSMEGFALGVSLRRDRMPVRRAWALLALFSVATPIGILAGAGVGEALEDRAGAILEAAFLALAAGTFVYVATLDILREEFVEPGGRLAKWLPVACGAAIMGLLAVRI